ncbi:hypothetical protein [Pedobacter duraquae]|uniref:Uncharacterized protein n=1 Tax=Pedobacter duraquae TaxID=425511 RepID=A0A4R6IG89_9SPHI|nr:hypothetical protein [Pedobacter duraquae]TDO20718.1 hypothetical protein CLV32_3351 [Pedobacter duraquae]
MAFKARLNFYGWVYHVLQRAFSLSPTAKLRTVTIPTHRGINSILNQLHCEAKRKSQLPY